MRHHTRQEVPTFATFSLFPYQIVVSLGSRGKQDDLFDAAFELFPLQHDAATTASADNPDIGSSARDSPFVATAGMGLSHSHSHSNENLLIL